MAQNQTYRTYLDYIFGFFSQSGCRTGQGGYILRGLNDRARNAGFNQEQIRIIQMLIFNLTNTGYLESEDGHFFKLTALGYAYMQDGTIESGRVDLPNLLEPTDDSFSDLWLLIGKGETAPFYLTGPEYYKIAQPFLPNLPVSYTTYMEELKAKDIRLSSRVIWYEQLWKQIKAEDKTAFLADLSGEIARKYDGVEIQPEIITEETQIEMEKKPLLFISHASKDKEFATALVTLLEQQGFTHEHVFCSSVDGYGFDVADDIYTGLLKKFHDYQLFVLFVHSPRFYARPITLNEMGAAWVLKTKHASILTDDMQYEDMTGVVDNHEIAVKVNADDAPARMTQLMNQIRTFFGQEKVDSVIWERHRNEFWEKVNAMTFPKEEVATQSQGIFTEEQTERLKTWIDSDETELFIIASMDGGSVIMGEEYPILNSEDEVKWRDFIDNLEEMGFIKNTGRVQGDEPIYRRTGKLNKFLK